MTPDIKRILVPVDFSTNSDRALEYAHGLAQKFDAAVRLVHVCETPGMMTSAFDAYAVAYADWSQRLGEEAEKQLTRSRRRCATSMSQPKCGSAPQPRRSSKQRTAMAPT